MKFQVRYRGEPYGEFAAECHGAPQCSERLGRADRCPGARHSSRLDPASAGDISQREASNGCERRGERHSGGGRFRASSHGHPGHHRGGAPPLAGAADLGRSRAALQFHAPQSVSGRLAGVAGAWRPSAARQRASRRAIGRRAAPRSRNGRRPPSASWAKRRACCQEPMPSPISSLAKQSPAICSW